MLQHKQLTDFKNLIFHELLKYDYSRDDLN